MLQNLANKRIFALSVSVFFSAR